MNYDRMKKDQLVILCEDYRMGLDAAINELRRAQRQLLECRDKDVAIRRTASILAAVLVDYETFIERRTQ